MKTVITVCYLTGWEHDTVTEGYGFSLGVLRNIPVKRPLSCQNKKQQQRVLIKNHYIKPEKGGNYCIFFPALRSNHSDSFLVDLNTILLLSLSNRHLEKSCSSHLFRFCDFFFLVFFCFLLLLRGFVLCTRTGISGLEQESTWFKLYFYLSKMDHNAAPGANT